MLKKCIGIISLVSISIVLISGLSFAGQWAKTYGGAGYDNGNIWPLGDGNYYLSGFTDSFGAGKIDGLIAKLNATGGVTWAKTFGGAADDYLSVMDLADGSFFVSGTSESFGTGNPATPNTNIVFAKYNSSWSPVFQKVLGGAGDETGYFTETNDKGFLFLGESNSYGSSASDQDMLLFKIASGGGLKWEKAYHYSLKDDVTGAVELNDGYLVSASVEDKLSTEQNPIYDILLMKLNKTYGVIMWNKLLSSTSGSLENTSFYKLNDGNYLLAGGLTTALGSSNILLVKISPAGDILLSKTYGSSIPGESASVANIIRNTDGSLIVTGIVSSLDMTTFTYTSSVLVMKLNADLSVVWEKKLSNGVIFASVYKAGGQILLAGSRAASMTAQADALYAKLNATTYEPAWARTFGGTRTEFGWLTRANTNYMLSGNTGTFGGATNTQQNIFGIILDSKGNYANCNVKSLKLTVGDPGLAMSGVTITQKLNIPITSRTPGSATSITLKQASPTITPKNICPSINATQDGTLAEPLDLQEEEAE